MSRPSGVDFAPEDSDFVPGHMGKHLLIGPDRKILVAEADLHEYLRKTHELRDSGKMPEHCRYKDTRDYHGRGSNEDKQRIAVLLWWAEKLINDAKTAEVLAYNRGYSRGLEVGYRVGEQHEHERVLGCLT